MPAPTSAPDSVTGVAGNRTRSSADRRRKAAQLLSALALTVTIGAAAAGLVVHDVYGGPDATAQMLRGYDAVSLGLVAPLLGWSMMAARAGSLRGHLVWIGALAFMVYNYAIYLFGAGFNDLFLLHVLAFAAAVFALPLALTSIEAGAIARSLAPQAPTRVIACVLGFLAASLGGMWVLESLRYAVTGSTPAGSALVETDTVVHLGMALDLALLVPAYALAAVLLWRRTGWGVTIAAAVLVSGTLHQASYLVALPFQAAANVPGARAFDPGEPPIAAAFLVCSALLLAGVRRSTA